VNRGVLATVAGIVVGLAGVLLFVRVGGSTPDAPSEPTPAAAVMSGSGFTGNGVRGPGIPPAPGASQNAPPQPDAGAPTANLKRVAGALLLRYRSVSVAVWLPAGLNLTARVDVSVLFDEGGQARRVTQTYDNARGNRFLADLAEYEGARRRADVVVSLAEPNGATAAVYAVRSTVALEPLYDILVSPLSMYLVNNCDDIGESEPHVYFRLPNGSPQDAEIGMSGGQTVQIGRFALHYREVGQSANLGQPTFAFYEEDIEFGFHNGYTPPPNPPLLPGRDRTIAFEMTAGNDNFCTAKFSYRITYKLRRYTNL
jgi:hypothetical protein